MNSYDQIYKGELWQHRRQGKEKVECALLATPHFHQIKRMIDMDTGAQMKQMTCENLLSESRRSEESRVKGRKWYVHLVDALGPMETRFPRTRVLHSAFNTAAQSIEIELGFQQVLNTESGTS
ncbi:secretory carrier-associated membrane protein 1 [Cricetulus griseus]|nr:secretory carrier-associated membrane protein 1 [Cricetulus griseus]